MRFVRAAVLPEKRGEVVAKMREMGFGAVAPTSEGIYEVGADGAKMVLATVEAWGDERLVTELVDVFTEMGVWVEEKELRRIQLVWSAAIGLEL